MSRGNERTKLIRFLYWLDDNFAELAHNLTFDEIAEEYLEEMDANIVSVDDVLVIFDDEFGEVSLEDFVLEDEAHEDFISGE
jgi:hypothetical protein